MGERGTRIFSWSTKERAWSCASANEDPAGLAVTSGGGVAQLWFDDDAGVTLQLYAPSGLVGELSVPFEADEGAGEGDFQLVGELVARGMLSSRKARDLEKKLRQVKRRAWFAKHGLETLLGFPDAPLVAPEGGAAASPAPPQEAAARAWTPEERAVVDLHVHYWARVWSMNSFSLYNRYKKHLPASERREVDLLANAVALGDDEEIRTRVERILGQTWEKEDWNAFIRSPKLDDPGTDPDEAETWQAMIGRA